jgi:hypothetical protein
MEPRHRTFEIVLPPRSNRLGGRLRVIGLARKIAVEKERAEHVRQNGLYG